MLIRPRILIWRAQCDLGFTCVHVPQALKSITYTHKQVGSRSDRVEMEHHAEVEADFAHCGSRISFFDCLE